MFPGRYSEIFGLGERLGCILNLGHSFDAIEAYLSETRRAAHDLGTNRFILKTMDSTVEK